MSIQNRFVNLQIIQILKIAKLHLYIIRIKWANFKTLWNPTFYYKSLRISPIKKRQIVICFISNYLTTLHALGFFFVCNNNIIYQVECYDQLYQMFSLSIAILRELTVFDQLHQLKIYKFRNNISSASFWSKSIL